MANSKKQTINQGNETPTSGRGESGATTASNPETGSPTAGSSGQQQQSQQRQQGGMTSASSSVGSGSAAGTAPARSLYDQARETAGHAYEAAAEKATTKLEEQKTNLSGGLSSVADSVRRVSENLRGPDVQDGISKFTAEYSGLAAQKIEDVANYFDQKSVREMYGDVERFARRNPAVFVGGAFALGLLAARFLKSGAASSASRSNRGQISTGDSNRGTSGSSDRPERTM